MVMHTGKPDGIRALTIGALAMIGIVLLPVGDGLALRTNPKGRGIEGFRELRWGASVEESRKIYPDLQFERYVVTDGKEEPWKVYGRRAENTEIEQVTFDSIEYWFRGGRFSRIRAVLQSGIGPRTLVTPAENDFYKIRQRLRNRYGEPSKNKVDYLTEFIVVVKEATWIVDRSVITVKYVGVGTKDVDSLTLTMQEKPE